MSEPVGAAPATGSGAKPESRKPTRALPSERVGWDRARDILAAYGAVAASEPVSPKKVAEAVGIHEGSVSVLNGFFVESGFVERVGLAYKASPSVVAFHQAREWDGATAGHKLAPTLRMTWYWQAIAARLSVRALPEDEVIRLFAEACGTPDPSYKSQLRSLLDYLDLGGMTVREGGQVRRGPSVSQDRQDVGGGEGVRETPPVNTTQQQPAAPVIAPGFAFDVSISISAQEIQTWKPEQITAFFTGLATVINAKAGIVESKQKATVSSMGLSA